MGNKIGGGGDGARAGFWTGAGGAGWGSRAGFWIERRPGGSETWMGKTGLGRT